MRTQAAEGTQRLGVPPFLEGSKEVTQNGPTTSRPFGKTRPTGEMAPEPVRALQELHGELPTATWSRVDLREWRAAGSASPGEYKGDVPLFGFRPLLGPGHPPIHSDRFINLRSALYPIQPLFVQNILEPRPRKPCGFHLFNVCEDSIWRKHGYCAREVVGNLLGCFPAETDWRASFGSACICTLP